MPHHASRSPLRLLAPVSLVIFGVAFFAIILSSGSGDGGGSASSQTAPRKARGGTHAGSSRQVRTRGSYTVKTGDTLAGIAARTGVPVERLQELNPELDPQALVSGQKIRLRE